MHFVIGRSRVQLSPSAPEFFDPGVRPRERKVPPTRRRVSSLRPRLAASEGVRPGSRIFRRQSVRRFAKSDRREKRASDGITLMSHSKSLGSGIAPIGLGGARVVFFLSHTL